MENQVTNPTISKPEINQETVAEPAPQHSQKQKSMLAPFLSVVSLVLLVSTAFFAYHYFQNNQDDRLTSYEDTTNQTIPSTQSPTDTPTTQTTNGHTIPNGWKQFNSEETNLTFIYPPSIIETKIGSSDHKTLVSLVASRQNSQIQEAEVDSSPVVIYEDSTDSIRKDYYFGGYKWTEDIFSKLSLIEDGETTAGTIESQTKIEESTINGVPAIYFKASPQIEGEEYFAWALIDETRSFLIMYFPSKSNLTEVEFKQIVDSLDF